MTAASAQIVVLLPRHNCFPCAQKVEAKRRRRHKLRADALCIVADDNPQCFATALAVAGLWAHRPSLFPLALMFFRMERKFRPNTREAEERRRCRSIVPTSLLSPPDCRPFVALAGSSSALFSYCDELSYVSAAAVASFLDCFLWFLVMHNPGINSFSAAELF